MRSVVPFRPFAGTKVSRSVSGSTASVAIGILCPQVRLSTLSTDSQCFIEFGTSGVEASTTTSMAFNAGLTEIISVPIGATHIAAITASGTATLQIQPGEGV